MSRQQHRFYGAPDRFLVLAEYVYENYGKGIKYIADVAGGQGELARILNKKFNYKCETVDARGRALKGVPNRQSDFALGMADFYDLIIGLHPDEATRAVAEAAMARPVILIPCCNFWSDEKLGRDELVEAIEAYYLENSITFQRVVFKFKGPKNIGIVSEPPKKLPKG